MGRAVSAYATCRGYAWRTCKEDENKKTQIIQTEVERKRFRKYDTEGKSQGEGMPHPKNLAGDVRLFPVKVRPKLPEGEKARMMRSLTHP